MKNKFFILCSAYTLLTSTTILNRQPDFPLSFEDKIYLKEEEKKREASQAKYFNTKDFLHNIPLVEKTIQREEGFQETIIQSLQKERQTEQLSISCFTKLGKNNNKGTLIQAPGAIPGLAPGMVTLYGMLKNRRNLNYAFINTRGKGNSQGDPVGYNLWRCWNGIKHFGEHEYLDVAACIQHVVRHNKEHKIKSPIFLHGLCAGGYNSIKALKYLKDNDPESYHEVKAIVLDSSWAKITDLVESTIKADTAKQCKAMGIGFLAPLFSIPLTMLYRWKIKPHYEKQESIAETIKEINQEVVFIHAENDQHIPFEKIEKLIINTPNKQILVLKNGGHGINHLKEREIYEDVMLELIDKHN